MLVWWSGKNVPHRLRYLSTLLPVGGAVWGISADLLEVEHHWDWALRVHSLTPLPVSWLCYMIVVRSLIPQLLAPASMPVTSSCYDTIWNQEPKIFFNISIFFKQVSLDHAVSSQQHRVGGTLRKTKLNRTQGNWKGRKCDRLWLMVYMVFHLSNASTLCSSSSKGNAP